MAIAGKTFHARVGPVGDVEACLPWRYRDAVCSAELPRSFPLTAESQIIPNYLEAVFSIDPCRQNVIEIGIARSNVIEAIQVLHSSGRKIPPSQKKVVNLRLFEVNGGGRGIEGVNQFPIECGCEDLAVIVGRESQIRSPIRVIPDCSVMQVDTPHFMRSVQHIYRLQIATDLQDSSSGKGEIGLLFARPAVNCKATMSVD